MNFKNINLNTILFLSPCVIVPSVVYVYGKMFFSDMEHFYLSSVALFIGMLIYVFYERNRVVKIIILDTDVIFIKLTTKEIIANIEDVLCVREVTYDKQFHFEVYLKNIGWLKMADMLIGVEIIKNKERHRVILKDDFPFAKYKV